MGGVSTMHTKWRGRRDTERVDRAGEEGEEMESTLLLCCITLCSLGLRRSNYLPVRLIVHPRASGGYVSRFMRDGAHSLCELF